MKRLLTFIITIALVVSLIPVKTVSAENERKVVGDFLYTADNWYYKGKDGDVTLPDCIEVINNRLFNEFRGNVETLYIPGTVKRIDMLTGLRSLKKIVFETGDVEIGEYAMPIVPENGIVAPQGSKAWEYAKKKGIYVTSGSDPCFEKDTIYVLKGDWIHTTFFNQKVMNYTGDVKWSVGDSSIIKKKKMIALNGEYTGKKRYKAMKTGKTTMIATLDDGSILSYNVVVLKRTEKNRLKCFKKLCEGMTEKEKAKYLAKWFFLNIDYDEAAAHPYKVGDDVLGFYGYKSRNDSKMREAASTYGSLLKLQAYCAGISAGYKAAANAVGLDCITITGTLVDDGHAWNMVCIDGYWYYVDATNTSTVSPFISDEYGFNKDGVEKNHPTIYS